MEVDDIGADLLRGVKSIAAFINEDERSTYHKLSTGQLPGGKEGVQWIASRQVLREHYEKITSAKREGHRLMAPNAHAHNALQPQPQPRLVATFPRNNRARYDLHEAKRAAIEEGLIEADIGEVGR